MRHPGKAWFVMAVKGLLPGILSGAFMVFVLAAGSSAAIDTLMTSNGHRIPQYDVARLDCAEISEVLRLIDATGYRGPEPLSPSDKDYDVFLWEDQLAREMWRRCGTEGFGRWKDVFPEGFN